MVSKIILSSLLILLAGALLIGSFALFSLWEVVAGSVLAAVMIAYHIATK